MLVFNLNEMNNGKTFETFLANSSSTQDLGSFAINLIFAFILSIILGYVYRRYGRSLSNRNSFSQNFSLLTMATMLIISIVKSSLALSLGLVGALSIVRFRTALKEPEELIFAFLCIAIGLGFGANQRIITIVGFIIISSLYILKQKSNKSYNSQLTDIVISSKNPSEINTNEILEILSLYSDQISLKRFTEDRSRLELAICMKVKSYDLLIKIKEELFTKFPNLSINFVDHSLILGM